MIMYCSYQDRTELEDDLYQGDEGDSDGSEDNSELEFRLYSQLHYSNNAGEMEEHDGESQDRQQLELSKTTADVDGKLEGTAETGLLRQNLKTKGEKRVKQNKGKSIPKGQKSSVFEEVIVIVSSPDVISISGDDTTDDDKGVCDLKGQSSHRLRTSTPAQQVRELLCDCFGK